MKEISREFARPKTPGHLQEDSKTPANMGTRGGLLRYPYVVFMLFLRYPYVSLSTRGALLRYPYVIVTSILLYVSTHVGSLRIQICLHNTHCYFYVRVAVVASTSVFHLSFVPIGVLCSLVALCLSLVHVLTAVVF